MRTGWGTKFQDEKAYQNFDTKATHKAYAGGVMHFPVRLHDCTVAGLVWLLSAVAALNDCAVPDSTCIAQGFSEASAWWLLSQRSIAGPLSMRLQGAFIIAGIGIDTLSLDP